MRLLLTIFLVMSLTFTSFCQSAVKWYSVEEAFALVQKQPRKIMIDVYTDWCSWCKVMDRNTFSHPVIAQYLNANFYPVKFNAEQKEDVIIQGTTFKFVPGTSRGYHELAASLLNGQLAYPSVVFLDDDLSMIQPVQGYIQARQFDGILRFIGDDLFRTQTWESFQSHYNSPIPESTESAAEAGSPVAVPGQ